VIGGKTLVERALDVVPQDKVRETVVVLGHDAESVAASMRARRGVRVLENADYRAGMATSIRAGILSLAGDTEGVMLLLADQPSSPGLCCCACSRPSEQKVPREDSGGRSR